MFYPISIVFSALTLISNTALAQPSSTASASCASTLTPHATPSVAPGYIARLVATNLTTPRGIRFDSQGALLVVEQNSGITALNLVDHGNGCISEGSRRTVINDTTLNHGIEISGNGSVLYASSSNTVYSWAYSAQGQMNTSAPVALITNMSGTDHTTRTLLLSKKVPGLLLVTRGSTSNLDYAAASLSSGHSQVKAFNLLNRTRTYDFNGDGLLLGWGLRNDVGIDEEPLTGGIFTVENSADDVTRQNVDVHQNNPGEELNFLGYLNGTASPNSGRNFGYPECFAAWNTSALPDFAGSVGEQFAIGTLNSTNNDTLCGPAYHQPPRLVFQAHMAPLDILFNTAGSAAWVTFHGSWDRNPPSGYKLSAVSFANGQPTEPSNSTTAAIDILSNSNLSACPTGCFRPVGLAWDSQGRLFMSSDATGEIWVVLRADGMAVSAVGSNSTGILPSATAAASGTATGGGPSASASHSSAAAPVAAMEGVHVAALAAGFVVVAALL